MLSYIRNHKTAVGASTVVVLAGLAWLAFGIFGVHTLFIDDVVSEAAPTFDVPVAAEPASISEPVAPITTAPPAAAPVADDPTTTTPATPATPATSATTVEPPPNDTADLAGAPDVADETATTEPAAPAAEPGEIVAEAIGSFESEAHPTSGTATVLGNGSGQRFLRFEDFETDNGPDLNVYLFDDETGDFVDLGDLKGNIGEQNYEVPADVDLERFDRVSIWCVRFGVGFGSAELMAG